MNLEYFMNEAYKEALAAYELEETPIGAVVVYENVIIGKGRNLRNTLKNPLKHAEILAIDQASQIIGDWRLENCFIFVTVEPCPMCAGAILQARIKGLYYGAANKKAGSCGSIVNLLNHPGYNHHVEVQGGVMEEECSQLMSDFFRKLRKKTMVDKNTAPRESIL